VIGILRFEPIAAPTTFGKETATVVAELKDTLSVCAEGGIERFAKLAELPLGASEAIEGAQLPPVSPTRIAVRFWPV
jgi:hypothetical protein